MDLGATQGVTAAEDIVNGTHMDTISNYEEMFEDEMIQRKGDAQKWRYLSHHLIMEISLHPLGIHINKFFDNVKLKGHYCSAIDFGSKSLEEAVKQLADVFVIRKFPLFREGQKGVQQA